MTYSGVLATILSGLEPAIAIVLACIPLLRPLYKGRRSDSDTSQHYGSGNTSGLFSKKSNIKDDYSLTVLDDDSSEIQLQPIKTEHNVRVLAAPDSRMGNVDTVRSPKAILVDTRWEVKSDQNDVH